MLSLSQKRTQFSPSSEPVVSGRTTKVRALSGSLFGNLWRGAAQDQVSIEPVSRGIDEVSAELKIVGESDRYSELVSFENAGTVFRDRLVAVLQEIAFDAMELGAREIYIGHPREYRYEFFVDDRGYQGAIKPNDYFGMLKLFGEEPDLEIEVDWSDVEAINLSLTNNSLNPVIHVSWRYRWVASFIEEQYSDQLI